VLAAVIHFDEEFQFRKALAHVGDALAERRVKDNDLGVGIVDQVGQLVVQVAKVDVDGTARV